ncbi:hypothetical protein GCN78_11530 [Janthinobacterium rivuli]|uniref:tetratricopeptide repeat protein n=1 Tax=Janthinobacterium sp. FT68W TaxID=2654255 RepID=UPI0012657E12|nr:hypothetical protein [Janthinobacterium sp. FT68W]KAB8051646.1 hypothetical protein GCN78_11530 [Janthinobacterium sp. FT68W]
MDGFHDFDGPKLPRARIGVFRGKPPKLVAKISIQVFADSKTELSLSDDSGEVSQILSHFEPDPLPIQNCSPAETIVGVVRRLRERLAEAELQVQDLPLADMEISFQFDVKRGIALGKHRSLHEQESMSGDIQKNIFDAIASIFTEPANALASKVNEFASQGEHQAAVDAVMLAREEGLSFLSKPPMALLDALCLIDISCLDYNARLCVCESRIAVATQLGKYDVAETDARELLLDKNWCNGKKRISLENIIAIAANGRGESETALSIWRRLSATEKVEAVERAWIWRNISLALPYDDLEARQAARSSVDAFLEAGDKIEAATSLMQLSYLLEHEGPSAALEQLDAMLEIVDQNGLIGTELRAALHHARGNRYRELQDWKAAMEEAERAIALRENVLGAEEMLISSLHLASQAARNMGLLGRSENFDLEAKKYEVSKSPIYYSLVRKILGQFESFTLETAESLLEEARSLNNISLICGIQILIATHNPLFTVTDRLGMLEGLLRELENRVGSENEKNPVMIAIATVLHSDGQYMRAASWFRKILLDKPLDVAARDMLIDCLWKSNDWNGAAVFLKEQIRRSGELPGLMYAYGRSLVELGDNNTAILVLTKTVKISKGNEKFLKLVIELRERALDGGGTMPSVSQDSPTIHHVGRKELEEALLDYAKFIASDKRMMFWKYNRDQSDYEWTLRPEKLAQDFLHAFLKARFRDRISIFEELATGAGRLDILLKFDGGLSSIIELKMCGFGYSSTYAASGEEQILHYMKNRSCHLGYLVVHDSRLDQFSSALLVPERDSKNSVWEIFIDVRPRFRKEKGFPTSTDDNPVSG